MTDQPEPVDAVVAWGKAIAKLHRDCKPAAGDVEGGQ